MLCGYKKYTCTGAGGLWYNQFERTVQSFGRTVYIYEPFLLADRGGFTYVSSYAAL